MNVWLKAGEHVIVSLDANEEVIKGDTAEFFRRNGMSELIIDHHQDKTPPPTCHKGNDTRLLIDEVFATPGVTVAAAGYLGRTDAIQTDHRLLWVDLVDNDFLGIEQPDMVAPSARRLTNSDIRSVRECVSVVRDRLVALNLLDRLKQIATDAQDKG